MNGRTERSPVEKHLGVLVEKKVDISRHYALAAQKASSILGYIKRVVASWEREMIFPLSYALVRPHLDNCIQVLGPQHKKDVELLEQIQRRKGHRDDQRACLPFLQRKPERTGLV